MTDQQDARREHYEEARRAFEDLSLEDRALFLIQESIATVASGVQSVGKVVLDSLDALFCGWSGEGEDEAPVEEAEAPEPEAKASPPPKKKTTTRKRTSGTKKTSSSSRAKKAPPKEDESGGEEKGA